MLRDMEDKLRDANSSLIKDNDSKNGRKIWNPVELKKMIPQIESFMSRKITPR